MSNSLTTQAPSRQLATRQRWLKAAAAPSFVCYPQDGSAHLHPVARVTPKSLPWEVLTVDSSCVDCKAAPSHALLLTVRNEAHCLISAAETWDGVQKGFDVTKLDVLHLDVLGYDYFTLKRYVSFLTSVKQVLDYSLVLLEVEEALLKLENIFTSDATRTALTKHYHKLSTFGMFHPKGTRYDALLPAPNDALVADISSVEGKNFVTVQAFGTKIADNRLLVQAPFFTLKALKSSMGIFALPIEAAGVPLAALEVAGTLWEPKNVEVTSGEKLLQYATLILEKQLNF